MFLSLVKELNLNWVLTALVNYPALYYHLFIWFLLMARVTSWLWSKRWFFRALYSRFCRWIDEDDRSGPKPSGFGNGKVNQTRRFSTSAAKPRKGLSLTTRAVARRIRGIFASITEFGAMVSLDSGWVKGSTFPSKDLAMAASQAVKAPVRVRQELLPGGTLVWRVLIKQSISLSDLFMGFGWRVIAACFPGKVNFTSRLGTLKRFAGLIIRIKRVHGSQQAIAYLKAGQLAIQKALAKDSIDSMRVINPNLLRSRLSSSGFPTYIPVQDRRLMLAVSQGAVNAAVIRFWLTLYSVFRVILIPGELKLSTIVKTSIADPTVYGDVVAQ
jgi:hypothetical protein